MKNLMLFILCLSFSSLLSAQYTASGYLKRTPAIPEKRCQLSGKQQDAFISEIENLSTEIKADAQKRSKESEKFMQANEEQMKANMAKQSGMSDNEIKNLQRGKKMSEAEKMEMANRMMQQKTDISLGEAQNLKNMSKEGKEAWAQGYAAEQTTKKQPQQNQAQNDKNRSMYERLAEQTALRNKITGNEEALKLRFKTIDDEAAADKVNLEHELKPLYEELNSINDGEGSTQADVEHTAMVLKRIHVKQDAFCEKFTPRMIEFLVQCRKSFEAALPDYDRVEQIQFEVTAAQTGTAIMTAGRGAYSIRAIDQYLVYLGEAFRYKLYRIE